MIILHICGVIIG